MAGIVDEHCTLILVARLYEVTHDVIADNGICLKDAAERHIEWCDYTVERPVHSTLVADVEAIVRNALKELGRRSFRDE